MNKSIHRSKMVENFSSLFGWACLMLCFAGGVTMANGELAIGISIFVSVFLAFITIFPILEGIARIIKTLEEIRDK